MEIKILGGMSVELKSELNYMFRQQADQTADIQTRFCFLVTFPGGSPGQYANGTRRKTVSYPFLQFESTTLVVMGYTSKLTYFEGQSKNKITID